MGPDEGPECSHAWVTVTVVADADGAHVERVCSKCWAVTLVGPDELAGAV